MEKNLWHNENYWVSPYDFIPPVMENSLFPPHIEIHDATLRDGEQTPGVVFRKEEKIRIASELDQAGIQRIEVGMPAVSEEDRQAIKAIAKKGLNAKLYAFARADPRDIQLCSECGVNGVIIELPIGKPKLEYQFKYGIEHALEISQEAIQQAKQCGLHTVLFPYDATRCEPNDLEFYLNGLKKGCLPDGIGLVDTMGCATPEAIAYLTRLYKQQLGIPVEIHVHNDFGMGLYASLAALRAGATVVHGCINGLGERCGNVATEEIAAAMQILYHYDLGINMEKLIPLCRFVETSSNYPTANKKPVIGRGNYVRESGIGADTVMDAPLAMFAVHPDYYLQEPQVVLGKKSGLLSIQLKLKQHHITLDRETQKKILGQVKNLGTEKKRLVTEDEFLAIVKPFLSGSAE